MFKKINQKIKVTIITFLIIFIVFESFLTIFNISQNIYTNFKNAAKENISLSIVNCENTITSAINATNSIVNNTSIFNVKVLDNLKQVAFSIFGVIYYSLDGTSITSSGMSGIPSLNDLKQINSLVNFINDSDSQSYFLIRKNYIPLYYQSNIYNHEYGIISYINKIYQNNILVGFLFIDISPASLYETFFNFDDYPSFSEYSCIMQFKKENNELEYLKNQNNFNYLSFITEANYTDTLVLNDSNKYIILSKKMNTLPLYLNVIVSKNYYIENTLKTTIPIIVLAILFIFLAIFFGYFTSYKIVKNLSLLNTKMNSTQNIIKIHDRK